MAFFLVKTLCSHDYKLLSHWSKETSPAQTHVMKEFHHLGGSIYLHHLKSNTEK